MRIDALTQPFATELKKIDNARKTEKEGKTGKLSVTDRSDFSSSSQRLSTTKAELETISASLSAQPEVRTEKIAEVKQKIESGYYNSDEFVDKLADKLLNEFGFQNKA